MVVPLYLSGQDWQLVWEDEFDGNELDTTKWSYQTGTGAEYGLTDWGNNEQQYYREQNVTVSDGSLHIVAKRDSYGGKGYTSGRIRTIEKGDWTYGRFEFRAKLPRGQGFWPAIWMLPTDLEYGGWAARPWNLRRSSFARKESSHVIRRRTSSRPTACPSS